MNSEWVESCSRRERERERETDRQRQRDRDRERQRERQRQRQRETERDRDRDRDRERQRERERESERHLPSVIKHVLTHTHIPMRRFLISTDIFIHSSSINCQSQPEHLLAL